MADGTLTELSLSTAAGGAAEELFDHELRKVLDNIQDPNTQADAIREVTLRLRIKPNEDRTSAEMTLLVVSKVAGVKPVADLVYMGMRHGRLVAVTRDPAQQDIFGEGDDDVLPMTGTRPSR